MIKLVFFDLYLTLIDVSGVNPDELDRSAYDILRNAGYRVEYTGFKDALKTVYGKWRSFRRSQLIEVNPRVWWQEVLLRLRIPAKIKLLNDILSTRHTVFLRKIKLYEDVAQILNYLKNRQILIGIISNCSDAEFAREELEYLGIDGYIDLLITSAEYGRRKPSIKLFEDLLESLPVRNDEIIMVGDDYENDVEPWGRLNVEAYLLDRGKSNSYKRSISSLLELEKIIG